MADVISVSALNKYVKSLLDSDIVLPGLAIRGEVTNFVNHYKSGHWYFTLRDETASVKAVMFRREAQKLGFLPKEGMRVVVRCRVSLYEATGSFQIYVSDLFPDGVGAAQLAFEQLKEKLEAEGLFAQEHKKPIPAIPQIVGIVTSGTGAALQDIRNVMSRRWPLAKILLASVTVQGDHAADDICNGIEALDRDGRADVIIVARGGGSREDLWVFNNEKIARTAYSCKTPLISAVGHEIDFSILDFVADLRAPTPSAAAELAVPNGKELLQKAYNIFMNIHEYMQTKLDMCYNDYMQQKMRCNDITPEKICKSRSEKMQKAIVDITSTKQHLLHVNQDRLARCAALAHSLSPYAVMGRGYAVIQNCRGEYTEVAALVPGEKITLKGSATRAICSVEDVLPDKGENDEKA